MGSNERKRKSTKRQIALVLVVIAAFLLGMQQYHKWREESELLKVSFENPDEVETPVFKLEIASTPSERKKGLMYRKSMPDDRGMLFVFAKEKQQSFWMKNTFLSLDMIFVNRGNKVIGVLHDVPILNEEPRKVPGKSIYVVELNAGQAKKHGIVKGSLMLPQGPVPKGVP